MVYLIKPALRVKGDSGSSCGGAAFRFGTRGGLCRAQRRDYPLADKTMKRNIEAPDIFYLNAAAGWVDLGNLEEALAELDRISPERRAHPDVLEAKWQILARMDSWEPTLPIAQAMCLVAPERPQGWLHQAVSLYRLKRTEEAWELLRPQADIFRDSWIIAYDLACYACQLGKIEEGREWLSRARRLGEDKQVRGVALADPDLEALWPELREKAVDA
jgi:tetratricopeptide (TPR) repeat protein